MFELHPANDRGHTRIGWLDSWHSFSFGEYYDPRNMGFSDLRVINDDVVAPGAGFGMHPHDNMEIISVVLQGELEHKDSIGSGSVTKAGSIQKMTAGTGILHSEYNPSPAEPVHFLQIWILPAFRNLKPEYSQKTFARDKLLNKLTMIVSPDAREDSLKIHQDAEVFQSLLEADKVVGYPLDAARKYWLQIAQGAVEVNGQIMIAGDGLAIAKEAQTLSIRGVDPVSNLLFFNLRS